MACTSTDIEVTRGKKPGKKLGLLPKGRGLSNPIKYDITNVTSYVGSEFSGS